MGLRSELERLRPLRTTVDLDRGETTEVELTDGSVTRLTLQDVSVRKDSFGRAVREAVAILVLNGERVEVPSNLYWLPREAAGVQVDCPFVGAYYETAHMDPWKLKKDARLRLWPAGSPWIAPGTFGYPVEQRWFASETQMGNDPVYVDGGDLPEQPNVYYHNGLDIGGPDQVVPVIAATDGTVVVRGTEMLPGNDDISPYERYDRVCVRDPRGWTIHYSHLASIAESVALGGTVTIGDRIGVLGKEGSSGGWAHLHFEVKAPQPSGEHGTEEGYPFLWQAYLERYRPEVIAVARPHHLARPGETVWLDASRSWAASGGPLRYRWRFTDGSTADGVRVSRKYERAGMYSEVVEVTDAAGRTDFDPVAVQVLAPDRPGREVPSIHPAYWPSLGLQPGQPITFQVRSFRTEGRGETWDFGDGTPPVQVESDGNAERHNPDGYARVEHVYQQAGDYLARVEHVNLHGIRAIGQVHVRVGK